MKNTIAAIALLFLMGCASNRPTLEDLMRTSYEVGCSEESLKEIEDFRGQAYRDMAKLVTDNCRERAKKFDPYQVGIYQNNMVLCYKNPHGKFQ